MKLLGTDTKLVKYNGERFLVAGLSLAPAKLSGFGNVCPQATPGCRASCVLWYTGRTVMDSVRNAMRRRTEFFMHNRSCFLQQLMHDIDLHEKQAARLQLRCCVRLNVASDLDWQDVARSFPDVAFYDYTKVRSRCLAPTWPENYALTYSVNEKSKPRDVNEILKAGSNVAVVYSTRYHPRSGRIDPLPESWRIGRSTWEVVDGDVADVRLPEFDGSGVIVGLRFKGSLKRRAKMIKNGFCVEVAS